MTTLDAHQQQLLRQLATNWRLTPATMHHKLSRGLWIPAPWLMYASSIIAPAIAKGGARIIISAPPRHGKTELVSVGTSVWVLENFPRHNVILTGYGADLVEAAAYKVRDIFWENEDLLKTRIRADKSRVNAFLTDQDGYMFSVGLGGAITGRGAHVLLIDDYIKEIKEALSPAHRQYIWDWFVTTARTRLEPNASIIIIATRWHSDDLIGRVIQAFPGRWTNIVFPAIATEADVIGRQPGEALFPERYPLEALQELQTELGSTFFNALYQQQPVDEGKKLTDGRWLKIIDGILDMKQFKFYRMWDLAATEGAGDFTTGSHCGWDRNTDRFLITSVKRRQISPAMAESLVRQTAIDDGTGCEVLIEQEPGSAGKALVEHYARNVLPEFKVTAIPATQDKLVRAQPFIAAAEAGKVFLLAGPWNQDFIKEFDTFTGAKNKGYDDQVDTASAAFTKATGKRIFSATWGTNLHQKKPSPPKSRVGFSIKSATWGS